MPSKQNLERFSKEHALDIEEIDKQHEELFAMLTKIDTVSDNLYQPLDDDSTDDLLDILGELRDHALKHFDTEEGYMKEVDYPGRADHEQAHNKFITDVSRLEGELMNGSSMPPIKIRTFMTDWWCAHIMDMDKQFGDFFKKNKQ